MVRGPKRDIEYKILKEDKSGLMKSFKERFKNELGPESGEIIKEDRDTIREQRQRLKEAEKQLQQAEKLSAQREKEKREVEVLRSKIQQTDAKIDSIQDKQGLNLESEAELPRLKELKKNYQTDVENKKNLWTRLQNKPKTEKRKKPRLTNSGPASLKKKVKQTPWKKGTTKQKRWTT